MPNRKKKVISIDYVGKDENEQIDKLKQLAMPVYLVPLNNVRAFVRNKLKYEFGLPLSFPICKDSFREQVLYAEIMPEMELYRTENTMYVGVIFMHPDGHEVLFRDSFGVPIYDNRYVMFRDLYIAASGMCDMIQEKLRSAELHPRPCTEADYETL